MNDLIRTLAAWALVHESADEGWKAAVARGAGEAGGSLVGTPDAFVDGLAALVAIEKERLKAEIAHGGSAPGNDAAVLAAKLDQVIFELGELRGRIESMQTMLDVRLGAREE